MKNEGTGADTRRNEASEDRRAAHAIHAARDPALDRIITRAWTPRLDYSAMSLRHGSTLPSSTSSKRLVISRWMKSKPARSFPRYTRDSVTEIVFVSTPHREKLAINHLELTLLAGGFSAVLFVVKPRTTSGR